MVARLPGGCAVVDAGFYSVTEGSPASMTLGASRAPVPELVAVGVVDAFLLRGNPFTSRGRPAVGRRPGRPTRLRDMVKWEYVTVPLLTHATKQILDNWGVDGWELVTVIPGPGGTDQLVAYLKRPKD
jgi:hypothetical protein